MAAAAAVAAAAPTEHLPTQLAHELRGHEGAVLNVRFNTQGTYCLTCGKDRSLRLWNPHKGTFIKAYHGHGYEVRDVAVFRDNSKISSVGGDKQVFLWDVASGQVVRKFRGHDATVNAVATGANDEVLVTGGGDQCLKVWDCRARSPEALQSSRAFKDDVTSVACLEANIWGASVDGTVRRFDVRMGRLYTDDLRHPVSWVSPSGDGLCVLAACLDSALRLLDKGTGELLASYRGHVHAGVKMACGFTSTDAHVVGSSEDGRVLFWELVEAAQVAQVQAHAGVVCGLALHPKDPMMVTCSVDGSVKVWV